MGHESRRIAVEEYHLDVQAERYKQVYEEMLAHSKRAAVPSKLFAHLNADNVSQPN